MNHEAQIQFFVSSQGCGDVMYQTNFYSRVVVPLETKLLALPLGALFNGVLYDAYKQPVVTLKLPDWGRGSLRLNSAEIGRLFMAPDDSVISILKQREKNDGTPVMVAAAAPARFCTIAFGLQACTAFRLGFAEITLFAGGRGLGNLQLSEDDLIGYQVWPKLGFDAPLQPADLNRDICFADCASVQDVVQRDPAWWASHGKGLEMRFDLSPGSRSWRVLLDYLYKVFPEELP